MNQNLPQPLIQVSGEKTADPQNQTVAIIRNPKYYPYYYRRVLSRDLQAFYRSNNFFRLIKQLHIQVIDNINDCYQLWEEFSPYESLFDTWEFRYVFWEKYQYKPHFIFFKTDT